jgi:hypothetical protein
LVDQSGPKPEIKREQEAYPPDMPDNPEALEHEKRNVIRANTVYIATVIVIFVAVIIYFLAT